jgi:hypothetical protein
VFPSAVIVRTATQPTVDGDLSDWAGITAEHPIVDLNGKPVASFKLQADDTHLYVAFSVRDHSPLRNTSAVPEELIKGGDAVGLCLGAVEGRGAYQRIVATEIAKKAVLVAMRPVWPDKRPHSYVSPVRTLTMDYVGPVEGARAAFFREKNGYTAELALPWAALGIPPPLAGGIPFDAQVVFSDPSGSVNAESVWWHAAGGPGYTTEDLPTEATLYPDTWGRARLVARDPGPQPGHGASAAAVRDAVGVPISFTLPRDARASLLVCASDGWIVRELLRAERLVAGEHTVRWNGRDRYDEPLPPGQYRWRLAFFDGMGTEFHGSVGNSARPPFRTEDGKGSMGGQHGGPSVIAADADGIYIAGGTEEGHPALRKIDRDGHTLWKRSMGGFGSGSAIALDKDAVYVAQLTKEGRFLVRLDRATGTEKLFDKMTPRVKVGVKEQAIGGMAVSHGKVYISFPDENRIGVIRTVSGTVEADVSVPKPLGLACAADGRILVCSGNAVLALDPASGALVPELRGLEAPRAVATDAQGRIVVSDLGSSQQVKVFEKGRQVSAIGTLEGRPETVLKYDPRALRNAVGVAVDAQGAVWIVERSPLRRVARFAPDGECELDLFGPVAYNVFGPDLDDLSVVYYQCAQKSLSFAKTRVDYAAYRADPAQGGVSAWRIESVFRMAQAADEAVGEQDLLGPAMEPGYGHVVAFTASNGHRYLWRFAKSNRATTPSGAAIWRWTDAGWVPAAFVSNKADAKSWSDANGDGHTQADEYYDPPPTRYFAWLDRDLTLYGWDGALTPARTDERGVPYYGGGAYAPYLREGEPPIPGGWVFNSMPDSEGAVYFAANLGPHRHLAAWDRAAENQILKVQDGRVRWVVGQHDAHARTDGDMSTVSGIAGVVDDILIAHIVEPAQYIAFTTDGFTLGNVVVDASGNRPKVGPNAIYIESFTGLFLKDAQSGKRLLFAVSSGDDRILEVTGPGAITRLEGSLALTSSWPRETVPAGQASVPYETWWGNNGTGYGIHAEGWQWTQRSAGLPITDKGVVIGDVRLRRDAGALHVLANVLDVAGGAANAAAPGGGDVGWGSLPGLELLLGPGGKDAARDPMPGDTRLFLAVEGKTPVAVAWRADGVGWKPIASAKVAMKPRWHGYGWRLEAEIPLELFPELSRKTPQRFRRAAGGKSDLQWIEEERLDLAGPVRLNAALHRWNGDGIRRVPWMEDGTDLRKPGVLQPARWGYANALVE